MTISKEWLAAQSERRKRLLENAIMFAASAPKDGRGPASGIDWAPATTDFLRAAAEEAVDLFNAAGEAIDAHHYKGHFGLRFESGIEHPESDKRVDAWDPASAPKPVIKLVLCGEAASMTPDMAIARAGSILDMLSASNTVIEHSGPRPTLTKRKQADLSRSSVSLGQAELCKQARQAAFNNLARDLGEEQARRLCDLAPWYFDNERLWLLGHLLPKEGTVSQWRPEFWNVMSDVLFIAGLVDGFQHQVTARDGWHNRKGRKTKRWNDFKEAANARERALDIQEDRQRRDLYERPTAGGMVPPNWPMKDQDGLPVPVPVHRHTWPGADEN